MKRYHTSGLKVQVQTYIDLETWEKLTEWLNEYGCTISKVVRAATKVGIRHQNEMFEEMNKKEKKYDY